MLGKLSSTSFSLSAPGYGRCVYGLNETFVIFKLIRFIVSAVLQSFSPYHTLSTRSRKSEASMTSVPRNSRHLACALCRDRKVKCDGGHPCKKCVKAGEICDYAVKNKASRAELQETILRLNQRIGRLFLYFFPSFLFPQSIARWPC